VQCVLVESRNNLLPIMHQIGKKGNVGMHSTKNNSQPVVLLDASRTKRPFSISDKLFNEKTAKPIWGKCNVMLSTLGLISQGIAK
jgi:glucuronate isomerase